MSEVAMDMGGKVVLVTGAARRVGAAVARRLHASGATVAVHCRHSVGAAEALVAELCAARPESSAVFAADLLDTPALPALVERVLARFGRLDGLVNNASSFHPTPLGEATEADWDDLVGSNLKAPLFLAQAVAPHLRAARGAMVNIVDIHAERPLKDYLVYSVAKAGLAGLTRALALELAPEVRVNGIAPGAIAWPEDGAFDPDERRRIVATTPLARIGSPEDIARAAAFLLGDASFVSGQILAVDGGRSIFL